MSKTDCSVEEWKPVENFGGVYEISNHGRLRRKTKNGFKSIEGTTNWAGYTLFHLRLNGVQLFCRAHHVVASSFIGDSRPDGLEINHKDGNKKNNRVDNLEWVTHQENVAHATRTGLVHRGSRLPHAKLTDAMVAEIRSHISGGVLLQKEIAARYGITRSNVSAIKRMTSWAI